MDQRAHDRVLDDHVLDERVLDVGGGPEPAGIGRSAGGTDLTGLGRSGGGTGFTDRTERAMRVAGRRPRTVGPVQVPSERERRDSAAESPALHRFRLLHDACAAPGLLLTGDGRCLAEGDARRLVALLDTGDGSPGDGTHQPPADDLPGLRRWVEWAMAAGVVRRHRGRLLAAWHSCTSDPLAAFDRAVEALRRIGPVSFGQQWEIFTQLAVIVEDGAGHVLAELLDAGGQAAIDGMCELVEHAIERSFQVSPLLGADRGGWLARELLHRFAECGVVLLDGETTEPGELGIPRRSGGTARLTPAGVPVAVRLARQAGIDVLQWPPD